MGRVASRYMLGLVAATGVVGLAVSPADGARPPNIVFVLADDLGWRDLACYGADLHETPHIDHLAARGLRFTQAYAAAPICSPTRASILTGKYPARLHMTIWYEGALRAPDPSKPLIPPPSEPNLPHAEVTLAERLRAAGYVTLHVGKWHLGDAAHYPETHGFDANIGGTFWGAPSTFFYPYAGYWSTTRQWRYVPHLELGRDGEYLTDRLTDEAIALVERVRDRPFFLHLAYHTVHTPIEAKDNAVDHFRRRIRPDMDHQNPVYAAMVQSLDENVGRLLEKIDALGIADETIVIFASDNGGYINRYRGDVVTSNAPLRSGKGSLYEGGIRVPWIVSWPGVTRPGRVCATPVSTIDVLPTVMDIAGVGSTPRPGTSVDGLSLVPVIASALGTLDRASLYFHYPHYYPTTTPVSAVRHGDMKLLYYFEDERMELYDLVQDPGEQNNLAERDPATAAELLARLRKWWHTVDARLPRAR